jgi:hypothetical protein
MNPIQKINFYFKTFGFTPKKFYYSLKGMPAFVRNYRKFKKLLYKENSDFEITNFYPCPDDRFDYAGTLPGHYFHQDIYAANKIWENNPYKHVDIGSRIDGFVAHVASFREIEVFDIRILATKIINVKFVQANLMSEDFSLVDYCDSVSCLHVIEHFGLGRYNDPIEVNGHIKGLNNIYKLLKKGGKFYFSTPIGKQRIEFDAHRVFSLSYLLELIEPKYKIESFAYIDDGDVLHQNIELDKENIRSSFNCNFGCAIFELTKL